MVPIELRRPKLSRYLVGVVFRCQECTFTCGSAGTLRTHALKHGPVGPYACRLCYFHCPRLSQLEAHLCDKHQVRISWPRRVQRFGSTEYSGWDLTPSLVECFPLHPNHHTLIRTAFIHFLFILLTGDVKFPLLFLKHCVITINLVDVSECEEKHGKHIERRKTLKNSVQSSFVSRPGGEEP